MDQQKLIGAQADIPNPENGRMDVILVPEAPHIATWVNSGAWKWMRTQLQEVRKQNAMLLEDEVAQMTYAIATRSAGERFATLAEARTRAMTIRTLTRIRTRATLLPAMDIMCSFLDYVNHVQPREQDDICEIAIEFMECYFQDDAATRKARAAEAESATEDRSDSSDQPDKVVQQIPYRS